MPQKGTDHFQVFDAILLQSEDQKHGASFFASEKRECLRFGMDFLKWLKARVWNLQQRAVV